MKNSQKIRRIGSSSHWGWCMSARRPPVPPSGDGPELPEPILELLLAGFDAAGLEPGAIDGTPHDYEQAMRKALPRVVQQHQQATDRAKMVYRQW